MAIQFLEYIFNELKEKRLPKSAAKALIRQFYYHNNHHKTGSGAQLHPLLHRNTSKLNEQRFSSDFSGEEFFLRDHVVAGRKVLPGVAYLEMVRAAIATGTDLLTEDQAVPELKNIVWYQPLVAKEEGVRVHISLYEKGNHICYDVYTQDQGGEEQIHSHGEVQLCAGIERPAFDIAAVQSRCVRHLPADSCYAVFEQLGLSYGNGFRCMEELWLGKDEVLVRLSLPAVSQGSGYVLHPGLLDSAIQGGLGLFWNGEEDRPAQLPAPFNVDKVQIYGGMEDSGTYWSIVRYSAGSGREAALPRLDIDVCEAGGKVLVSLRGLGLRAFGGGLAPAKPVTISSEVILFEPLWVTSQQVATVTTLKERTVILLEFPEEVLHGIVEGLTGPGVRSLVMHAGGGTADRYLSYSLQLYELLQAQLQSMPSEGLLLQVVCSTGGAKDVFRGLGAMLRTASLEHPQLQGQFISVEREVAATTLLTWLGEDAGSEDKELWYKDSLRQVQHWKEITVTGKASLPWKGEGVYVITGGLGGLGRLFAAEIVRQAPGAHVILTGRREPEEGAMNSLAPFEYRVCDVEDAEQVNRLFDWIESQYGHVEGIIHAAGVLQDSFIVKKDLSQISGVLCPKVKGVLHLDERSAGYGLDFFVMFSSVAGAIGNSGQGDYAAANSFMDHYARYRNELVKEGKRGGYTLSINWPLWAAGGMQADGATRQFLRQIYGMDPLATEDGLNCFYQALNQDIPQVMVLNGIRTKLQQLLSVGEAVTKKEEDRPDTAAPVIKGTISNDVLQDQICELLLQRASHQLSIPAEQLDVDSKLDEYGFDSVQLTQFANDLNMKLEIALTPALFFEYPNIRAFAGYLSQVYGTELASKLQLSAATSSSISITITSPQASVPQSYHRRRQLPMGGTSSSALPGIAVIGMSGRFPQAADINAFWHNLLDEQDCISEVPAERWDWRAVSLQADNHGSLRWGGFMEEMACFDPLFFNISPREALYMDPQQRLLMEYVWKVLEDGGYSAERLSGSSTGLFVGTSCGEYAQLLVHSGMEIEGFSSTGSVSSVGPNRMSYFLNLHGPSEPVETACSSSLVAIHRAVEYIQYGHSEMAIAGGINTLISPVSYISIAKAGMLSSDGRCKTFSASADGYVRGEGVGMLLLKRLDAAERDGDHIYGVIRGTAENHGGYASSLTAPSTKAQAALIYKAYERAGISPWTVGYIEAHGTGTKLGDPVEVNALKAAFSALKEQHEGGQSDIGYCGLGSVKSNIGHLELAAGVAGVIKVLLQLGHRTLVRSLHCEELNPYLELEGSPFYVVQHTRPWEAMEDESGRLLPRRAGVSSFGFGGVNAHVVLEEYIARDKEQRAIPASPVLIVLSARNGERLKAVVSQLYDALSSDDYGDADLGSIAYTLQVGREAMEERLGFITGSMEGLLAGLQSFMEGKPETGSIESIKLYRGQVKGNKETLSVFADEDIQQGILSWIGKRKYGKLLEAWVKGYPINWDLLYADVKPRRISLPSYPFTLERYWIDEGKSTRTNGTAANTHIAFDETFYDELLDQVINGETSVDRAVYKMIEKN